MFAIFYSEFSLFITRPVSSSSSNSLLFLLSGIKSSSAFSSYLVKMKSSSFRTPIITTNMTGKAIDMASTVLTTQRTMKHNSWMKVNR